MGKLENFIIFAMSFILGALMTYGAMENRAGYSYSTMDKSLYSKLENSVTSRDFKKETLECNGDTNLKQMKKADISELMLKKNPSDINIRSNKSQPQGNYVQGY